MKDNLRIFPGVTTLDYSDPDLFLEGAKGELEGVVIMGYDKKGEEYFASTYASGADVLWLLERCKQMLMEVPDGPEQTA